MSAPVPPHMTENDAKHPNARIYRQKLGLGADRLKLVNNKGENLGIIYIPPAWFEKIVIHGRVEFRQSDQIPVAPYLDPTAPLPMIRTGLISLSLWQPGAVELFGLTLEQFEQIDGCAFAAGAAYIAGVRL